MTEKLLLLKHPTITSTLSPHIKGCKWKVSLLKTQMIVNKYFLFIGHAHCYTVPYHNKFTGLYSLSSTRSGKSEAAISGIDTGKKWT